MAKDWIMTSTGRVFYPLSPNAADVEIRDIAHALAAVNRFNGHTREPYSVAQHSVLVSMEYDDGDPDRALAALLHDASEAYLCDVPRPLKLSPAFGPYRLAEQRLQQVIFDKFGLAEVAGDPVFTLHLKNVDRRMLRTEQAQLMPPPAIGEVRDDVETLPLQLSPWTALNAELAFLIRFHSLIGLRRSLAANGFTA